MSESKICVVRWQDIEVMYEAPSLEDVSVLVKKDDRFNGKNNIHIEECTNPIDAIYYIATKPYPGRERDMEWIMSEMQY